MRVNPLFLLGLVAVMGGTCDSTEPAPTPVTDPAWVGVYTLRADTVRYCVEDQTPPGRRCNCTAPGHMEGTLSLTADDKGMPTGEVKLRECPPGAPCGADVIHPVLKYNSYPPRATSSDSVNFCAGKCIGLTLDDDGIDFSLATVQGTQLRGYFRRADGNVRACGADYGPFIATRQ